MSLFRLSHNFVYLLYLCPNWDKSKINKQECGLTRKGHRNGVNDSPRSVTKERSSKLNVFATDGEANLKDNLQ